jgi:hypothetical protein
MAQTNHPLNKLLIIRNFELQTVNKKWLYHFLSVIFFDLSSYQLLTAVHRG